VAGGALVCGAGLIASAFAPSFALSMLLFSVAMAGNAATVGPFWTLGTSFVRGAGAAASIALINSVANFSGFLGPYALGYLREQTRGFTAGFVVTGAVIVGCGLVVLLLPALGGILVLPEGRDPARVS
jgi:ACS family tartrate transporter-like MFS transporter